MQHVHRWLGVIALGLSIFLVTTDMTIVALALPSLAQHFELIGAFLRRQTTLSE